MIELSRSPIGRLRVLAFLEGTSYLLILFVTMPLKYYFDMPAANMVVGMAHGILFIMYIFYVMQVKFMYKWNLTNTFLALLASVIPFGTFWADAKIFRKFA